MKNHTSSLEKSLILIRLFVIEQYLNRMNVILLEGKRSIYCMKMKSEFRDKSKVTVPII